MDRYTEDVTDPVIDFDNDFDQGKRADGISGFLRLRNEAEFLPQVIDTWIDSVDELVIVYNQCTDATPEIVEAYASRFPEKIRAYHYIPKVYPFGTRQQLELPSTDVHSFCFYSNFALSKTRLKICVKIDGDHIGIPENLKPIYSHLKINGLGRNLLLFSGINLWKMNSKYYVNAKHIAAGDGDVSYFPATQKNIFGKNSSNPYWEGLCYADIVPHYLGYIFWHTHFMKADKGLSNCGKDSELINRINESKISDPQLVAFDEKFKKQFSAHKTIPAIPEFPIYFGIGSLPQPDDI